jgi:hypothetical protein
MDRTGDHHVEPDKPNSKRQTLNVLAHLWNPDVNGDDGDGGGDDGDEKKKKM